MPEAIDSAKYMRTKYSLVGPGAEEAKESGLVEATWYTSPVPREEMRKLLVRKNGPAIRDTIIWFGILIASGYAGFLLWGTWWAILPFAVYGLVYGGSSDSRWHESLHGTAFRTDWMNNALYEVASFMIFRESTPWRWSHTRHHSDTIITGRDPEIASPRPPDISAILKNTFALSSAPNEIRKMLLHSIGKLDPAEKTYIPEAEHRKVFFKARIYVLIYLSVIGLSVYTASILPLMYIGLPSFYGAVGALFFGFTQHAGLAENVLDHRLNCRTIYMNPAFRFLYWNMNYHLEHHMFPLVPYHALPKLHELIKHDCPKPYKSIVEAYREIFYALKRQLKDPAFYIRRTLPTPSPGLAGHHPKFISKSRTQSAQGWIDVCAGSLLTHEDVMRFDCDTQTFAIYKSADNALYATDGICTHGNTHLADGLVKGDIIECPKHNGRFDIRDGSVKRPPVCVALKTYQVEERDGRIFLNLESAGGIGAEEERKAMTFRVVSNDNLATFIKELTLEPAGIDTGETFNYRPGDYIKIEIPVHHTSFKTISVNEPFLESWKRDDIFKGHASNHQIVYRNYSMASNPHVEKRLRFNIRIATAPPGLACSAGIGSTYVFNLKPGDFVRAIGPFGDFHIKESQSEMIYVGGGAGMAPLRSHISHLLDTLKTSRKVSFWYGARSEREMFYGDYFRSLQAEHPNFSFQVAFSDTPPEQSRHAHSGFIHEVLLREYLSHHLSPGNAEYYLCGPPAMIGATRHMLATLHVPDEQIAFDEF